MEGRVMDNINTVIEQQIAPNLSPERRLELEEYAHSLGLEPTNQELNAPPDAPGKFSFNTPIPITEESLNPTKEQLEEALREDQEYHEHACRIQSYAPKNAEEALYVKYLKEGFLNKARQRTADEGDQALVKTVKLMLAKQPITFDKNDSNPNVPTPPSEKARVADISDALESEIMRCLAGAFPNWKTRPSACDFYKNHVINRRTLIGMSHAKIGTYRTLKSRKAAIEVFLTKSLKMTVNLDMFRAANQNVRTVRRAIEALESEK